MPALFVCLSANAFARISQCPPPGSLVRFKRGARVVVGVTVDGDCRIQPHVGDSVFNIGEQLEETIQVEPVLLLSPLDASAVPAVYGIGCNYMGHCCRPNEKNCSGPVLQDPDTPTIFFKNRRSINHPTGKVVIPKNVNETDYEAELGIVIGRDCKDVSKEDALDCVFGYVALNDVSNRFLQSHDNGQWSFSKSFDGHAPIGPGLVPKSALGDASGLGLRMYLNGELKQSANTSDLIFGVADIISFISIGTTIERGTLIASGTPPGTGQGIVKRGDVMRTELDHVGVLSNLVI